MPSSLMDFVSAASSFVWGPFLLIPLLLLTGLFLTIRLHGIQFTKLWGSLYLGLIVRREKDGDGDISHFQALMTALAATVGTGNIVGVATAISLGGPGALFWMWMTGLVGMATKYSEALLSVKFRTTDEKGEKCGGPMYYLAGESQAASASSSEGCSRSSRRSLPSASATWCSRIRSHRDCRTPSASSPGSPAW